MKKCKSCNNELPVSEVKKRKREEEMQEEQEEMAAEQEEEVAEAAGPRLHRRAAALAISKDAFLQEFKSYTGKTTLYTCINSESVEMVAEFCNVMDKELIAHNQAHIPNLRPNSTLPPDTKLAVPAGCPTTRRQFARDTRVLVDVNGQPCTGLVRMAWAVCYPDASVGVEYCVEFDDGRKRDDIKEIAMLPHPNS